MLVIPGGRAPEYISLNLKVLDIVHHFANANKPIAVICHGAQLLAAAGIIKSRSLTAYPAVGPEINSAGGTYVEISINKAVVDGNLVTAPAWSTHPDWLAKFLVVLGTKIELKIRRPYTSKIRKERRTFDCWKNCRKTWCFGETRQPNNQTAKYPAQPKERSLQLNTLQIMEKIKKAIFGRPRLL